MPKTKLGKWSVSLIGAFIVFLLIFYAIITTGQRGGDTFFSNMYLTIPFLLAAISGISSFICGLIAIIKQRERSVLVFISSFLGFLITLFLAAEIIFPH